MTYVVIARWTAKPGNEEAVAASLEQLAPLSRRESGCMKYLVNRSLDEPKVFLLYEEYIDEDAYEAHAASEHFARHALGEGIPLLESRGGLLRRVCRTTPGTRSLLMGRFTVLVTDFAWPSLEIEREILARVDADLLVAETGEAEELIALAPQADAMLTNWSRIPTEALDAAPRCLVVSRFGIGVDNIPVERATELGILVTNVPAFCIDEVSDHTMALLLACSRHVVALANAVRRGAWSLEPARGQHRLRGQTLGIVGFGAIARSLVPKAAGFGLKVLAYTPRLDSTSLPAGVEKAATLDELLQPPTS